jgi:hypothetical protein
MHEKELEERICQLNDPQGGNLDSDVLANKFFIEQPEYADLKNAFRASKYHLHGWEWHQLVRVVLEPADTRHYMYERLLNLILKHRRSYSDYFELKVEERTFQIPNPIADLNRLEILVGQYFAIYHELTNQIHVDHLKSEYTGSIIRGKINWHKTICDSRTEFPLAFVTTLKEIDLLTPENILLVLCAEWMYRESSRLLHIEFAEPISRHSRSLLNTISEKMKLILLRFPFNEILNTSKKFWALSYNDPRIKSLEQEARQRIQQGLVYNTHYSSLLSWIDEFKQLDIPRVSAETPTHHVLESIENLDTVYEAWIFLEFVEYLYEKGMLLDFSLRDPRHCKFSYNAQIVTFWYEKTFTKKVGGGAWVLEHKPDFTAMLDNKILAVFDAKNYTKSKTTDAQNKMLAYMTNLDINFGALIFPYYPKNWDDYNRDQRREKLQILSTRFPLDVKKLTNLSWNDLPAEYRNLLPRKHMEIFESGKNARYHLDQTMCLLRMPPTNSEYAISTKKGSLTSMFEAIVSRI